MHAQNDKMRKQKAINWERKLLYSAYQSTFYGIFINTVNGE